MDTLGIRMNVDSNSFDNIFESKLQESKTNEAAYEQAEDEHEKLTGQRRYKSYESYRVTRSRRLKKK